MNGSSESEKSERTPIRQEKFTHSFVTYCVWCAWESLEQPKTCDNIKPERSQEDLTPPCWLYSFSNTSWLHMINWGVGTTIGPWPVLKHYILTFQRKHLAYEYFLTIFFHGEELLASRPTPKLEDHFLSAVRDCLFNLFAATLHIGGRSSIRNLRTRRAVVRWAGHVARVEEGRGVHKV